MTLPAYDRTSTKGPGHRVALALLLCCIVFEYGRCRPVHPCHAGRLGLLHQTVLIHATKEGRHIAAGHFVIGAERAIAVFFNPSGLKPFVDLLNQYTSLRLRSLEWRGILMRYEERGFE